MNVRWRDNAACIDSPAAAWIAGDQGYTQEARLYCDRCPVRAQCLEDAMDEEAADPASVRWSVRGGLNPDERYALYRERAGLKPPSHRRLKSSAETRQQIALLHSEGLTDQEIGEQVGLAANSVCEIRSALGLPANSNIIAVRSRIAELHADGLTDQEIADRLGKTRNSVLKARIRLGLPLNPARQAVPA